MKCLKIWLAAFLATVSVFSGFDAAAQAVARSVAPNDPGYADQWHLQAINMPAAWEIAKGSAAVKVAILDSGVDIGHPDLRDRIWRNPAEVAGNGVDDDGNGYVDDVNGWDFVENDRDPNPAVEPNGPSEGTNHGTLVAGIIGAAGDNAVGGTGVNWNVQLMPLRVLDSTGSGSTLAVEAAIRYAIVNGAKVINISFTGSGYSRVLAEALRDAHRAGIVIVAAAGNEGDTERGGNLNLRPEYPVCYRGLGNEPIVIGVASLDRKGARSSFTNYGSDCVALSAPGESIYTTQVWRPGIAGFQEPYGRGWSGSSMAAPVVSGVAALIASLHPGFTPAEIRGLLLRNAANIDALNPGYEGALGLGRVDAAASVRDALANRPLGRTGSTAVGASATVPVRPMDGDGSFAVASMIGNTPTLATFQGNFKPQVNFEIYGRGAAGEQSSVAMADLDGDGEPSFVVGAPRKDAPIVRAFNRDGALVAHFSAYEDAFRGGVRVARVDVDGDGMDEIMTAPVAGAEPNVRIFDARGKRLSEFPVFDKKDRSGVRLAAFDADGDGKDEIAVVSGGAKNEVRVFGTDGSLRFSFKPFERAWRGGLEIAAGDLDGDGQDEIVVAVGPGGPPQVGVFSRDGKKRSEWNAFAAGDRNGVQLAVIGQEGVAGRILAGSGVGGRTLRQFNLEGTIEREILPFGKAWRGGIRPAAYTYPKPGK